MAGVKCTKAASVTTRERRVLNMLRQLDPRQRDKMVEVIRSQLAANVAVQRIAGLKRLQIIDNRKIDRAFGTTSTLALLQHQDRMVQRLRRAR